VPRRNAVIDNVKTVSTAPAAHLAEGAQRVTVTFASGREGLLDVSQHQGRVWAEVLQSLFETGQPAYVEIEPETGLITQLLLPRSYAVAALRRQKDRLEVELNPSHAIHVVMRSNPHYDEIARALERARRRGAQVLVTEDIAGPEIVDARLPQEPGRAKR
jgi:hypothetical protein